MPYQKYQGPPIVVRRYDPKGHLISKWGRRFPPKIERKQVDLRYHSSKVEFIRLFFGRIHGLTI